MLGDANNILTEVNGASTQVVCAGACAFTDAGDLVTYASHGMPVGTPVIFSSISTTTGISVGTIYFVTNPSANTFQVASTLALALAGTALPLTTNGTGVIGSSVSARSIDRLARQDMGGGRRPVLATFLPAAPVPVHGGLSIATTTIATELFTTAAEHGLTPGTEITITSVATTTGLTLGTPYYVCANALTTTAFRLATTRGLARSGAVGDVLLATGDGGVTFAAVPTLELQAITSDNEDLTVADVIGSTGPIDYRMPSAVTFDSSGGNETVLLANHRFPAGAPVVFQVGTGGGAALPAEVTAARTYFVVPVTANSFRIALTREDALAGTYVLLNGNGTQGTTTPNSVQLRDGVLVSGGQPMFVDLLPRFASIGRRYIGLRYVWSGGPVVTSQFSTKFTLDEFQKPIDYPFGYAVP